MANTLEFQVKLNKLLEEASEKIEKMNGQYSKQEKMLEILNEAIKKMGELLGKAATPGNKLADSLESASEAAKKTGSSIQTSMQAASENVNKTSTTLKGFNGFKLGDVFKVASEASKAMGSSVQASMQTASTNIGAASMATKGFTGNLAMATKGAGGLSAGMIALEVGVKIVAGIGKAMAFVVEGLISAVQMVLNLGGGITEIGKSIIAFPFKMLEGLISMASVSGSNELAQELEHIRKQFGYLNKTAGGTIISLAKNMKGELANTGLSVWRTFGNLVERLQYFREYAEKLGETIDAVFKNLSVSQAEALGAFNKGLGFTDEGLKGIAQRSLATGENLNEINRQVGNYSLQLSKAFGVTMKLVSRDVGSMIADFEHFGHISVKEMTQAAVYARKLGIEVKSLGKLIDKYLNFEDAANSAAQLSQAFGLNVDAFQLMQEQDPAKKLDMLRKAFFATGRTIETMTIQERKLLAQQTGLSESELALAFAQSNRALSYDEIKKKGDAAKKSQLSQEQVLNKLAGAIERLTKSGSAMQGGFFDRFIQGFVSGIRYTKEFRELMRNLQRSLMMTFYAGRQVGRAFEQLFPGVKDFFGGLRDMFNPQVMKRFLNKVVGAFKDFFREMTTNPAAALPKLLDKLQAAFLERFSAAGPGASKVFEGIKKFLKAVGYIFLTGIKEALLALGKVIAPLLNRIFSNETFDNAGNQIESSVDGIGDTLSRMFKDVFGEEGSPARRKIAASLSAFAESIWEATKFVIGKLAEKFPALFELIADALSNIHKGVSKSKTGDKFVDGLATAYDKARPHVLRIFESLGDMLIEAIGEVISSEKVWVASGKAIISTISLIFSKTRNYISNFLISTFNNLGTLINEIGDVLADSLGNGVLSKTVRGVFRFFGLMYDAGAILIKAITKPVVIFWDFLKEVIDSPQKAVENLQKNLDSLITEILNDLKRALNRFINVLPDSIKSALGLTPFVIPPSPPPSRNPLVQTIQQAEEQSRTSGRNIQTNLTNALNVRAPEQRSTQSSSSVTSSLSEQVSSIRESIQSASEVGRIDQTKAEESIRKLQEFATRLGPTLKNTQTILNRSLEGVDLEKLTSNIQAYKSIIENVNSIRALTSRQLKVLTVSELMPLVNSIDALTVFINSPFLIRLENALTTAETSARISGIQNTSNAIKEMVDSVNQTSRALAKLQPVNIETNLKRLAGNFGLGRNSEFTIKNENFNVNVNLTVHIDAKELEKILIERPDTRIRHT